MSSVPLSREQLLKMCLPVDRFLKLCKSVTEYEKKCKENLSTII